MSSADWWAKQLGTTPQQPVARPANLPTPPSQQPMTPYVAPQPQAPATKAQSVSQTTPCPECYGNNYMSIGKIQGPGGLVETWRCYDCGYPNMQSGSTHGALTGAKVEGSARQAIGNDVQSGWNPMPAGYNPDGTKQ